MIYSLFGISFDEGRKLDPTSQSLPEWFFDTEQASSVVAVVSASLGKPRPFQAIDSPAWVYSRQEFWDVQVVSSMEVDFFGVAPIDLFPLVPDKFLKSQTMVDLLSCLNVEIGTWIRDISDLTFLRDPYSVGEEYISYLADLIGLKFVDVDNASIEDKRRQLIDAISWYKIKGTYASFDYIASLSGLSLNIYDLYSDSGSGWVVANDGSWVMSNSGLQVSTGDVDPYEVFVETPWFMASYEEELPHGTAAGISGEVQGTGTSGTLDKSYQVPNTLTLIRGVETYTEITTGILQSDYAGTGTVDYLGNWTVSGWTGTGVIYAAYSYYPNQVPEHYFKTPHFVLEIKLDTYKTTATSKSLVLGYDSNGDYGATLDAIVSKQSVNVYAGGNRVAIDNGSGGFTNTGTFYSVSGVLDYISGAIGVTITPALPATTSVSVTYGVDEYLWKDEMFTKTSQLIERSRPINTVARTRCLLEATGVEGSVVTTNPQSHVASIVTTSWDIERKYFDENTPKWYLDTYPSGTYRFDQAMEAFLSTITKFQFGAGHKGVPPHSSFTLEDPFAFIGDVDPVVRNTDGSLTFNMVIPNNDPDTLEPLIFTGISELVLISSAGNVVVIGLTFPDTDKTEDLALKIKVTIAP